MKKVVLFFALIVGLLSSASTLQAQTVNMSRYITLTVKSGEAIKLNFMAAANGTPVRIVSGSNTEDITVYTNWIGSTSSYTANGTTMTVYGDLTDFDCRYNGANLTALDASHNTQLKWLWCSENNLTNLDVSKNTQLKWLWCSENNLTNLDVSKNTQLEELDCSSNQLTALNVSKNTQLNELRCFSNQLTILDVSKNTQLKYLSCSHNNLTSLDVSKNTQLNELWCSHNNLTSFDVSKNTQLKFLGCSHNNLTSLDVSKNTQLRQLHCYSNRLTSLDVSKNTQLEYLWCYSNQLNSLDVSKNTQLRQLRCFSNQLTTLDVSKNTRLTDLYCWGNNFTTAALDAIYCALPARISSDGAWIFPLHESSSAAEQNMVVSTNAANATAKKWKVLKYKEDLNTDIATTGSYVCSGGGGTTVYDLRIAGVQVTSANCSDLSVIDSVSGTVKYDPATKTLTLQNATISVNTTNAIVSSIDGLTIKVIGTNNLTATMAFYNTATITGGGTLNVEIQNYSAIYVNETNLTIDSCTVNAKGKGGISGQHDLSNTLTIKNSTITAEGADYGSIAGFASLTLDGCAITWPVGAAFDASLEAVALSGVLVSSKVVISPTGGSTTYYDLRIAGVQVTSANCSDLSVISGVSGTVKYNPTNKVLTLDGATIQTNTDRAIDSYIDGLTIKVIGTNNLTTGDYSTLSFGKPLTITGGGVLNANSVGECGIYSFRTNLTIDGCTVNAKGKLGIAGNHRLSDTLTIKNSTVTAEGADYGSIINFASLTLDSCAITQPVRAAFYPSLNAVAIGDSVVTSKVVISPTGSSTTTYDLYIAGVQVTSANCSDLSVISGVSGTVKYDPTNKVLTLDGATIQIKTSNAIDSRIVDLTVKVIGTNNLMSTMAFYKTATITGGGTLNVEIHDHPAIYVNGINLTIDGCTVNAKGKWGIAGDDGSSETLTIKNSTVTAEGASKGSIADFAGITLDGCAITQPAGAAFDASLHAVALGGAKVKSKVVISPTEPNMSSYITLTVKSGEAIKLDFKASAAGIPVRIVSGSTTQNITVGTSWYGGTATYTADGTEMKVYGDLIGFDCSGNGANLTALDVSHNTQLTELWCHYNLLSSLDISKNRQLNTLYCWDNKFSTQALDDIYCALPVRSASDNAEIVPVESASAPNHATVIATNAQNALAKNWKVLYAEDNADVSTTGKHKCSATDIVEASAEPALTLYPNPVADVLYLSATARTIRVYDIYGIEVAHAADTDHIDVANLPAGVYTVKADGTVAKMVKR